MTLLYIVLFMTVYILLKKGYEEFLKKRAPSDFLSIEEKVEAVIDASLAEPEMSENKCLPEGVMSQRQILKDAINGCCFGSLEEKKYIKRFIKDILIKKIGISDENIDSFLPFRNIRSAPNDFIFEVLLYIYAKEYDRKAFEKIFDAYFEKKAMEKGFVDEEELDVACEDNATKISALSYNDKLEIFSNILYRKYGHGVIDSLRDQDIDGISGGVGGFIKTSDSGAFSKEKREGNYSFDNIWVMYKGNTVRLKFLSFKTENELRRVAKALIMYRPSGELSSNNPKIVADMKDGSRVTVVRPPFSESFAFFVRKFAKGKKSFDDLFGEENYEIPKFVLSVLVSAGVNIAVTGGQGTGKTSLLKALIENINPKFNLRIEEMVFELWIREEYPERNILSFRETECVSLEEGLDLMKKTDAQVMLFGEVANTETAALVIDLSQVSNQQLFTHHATSTINLVSYFRNALLKKGTFHDDKIALNQVLDTLRIDVHLEKDEKGHRYIERITEIIKEDSDYRVSNLVEYEKGKYVFGKRPSDKLISEVKKRIGFEAGERIDNEWLEYVPLY